jgi:hypothetical protein
VGGGYILNFNQLVGNAFTCLCLAGVESDCVRSVEWEPRIHMASTLASPLNHTMSHLTSFTYMWSLDCMIELTKHLLYLIRSRVTRATSVLDNMTNPISVFFCLPCTNAYSFDSEPTSVELSTAIEHCDQTRRWRCNSDGLESCEYIAR